MKNSNPLHRASKPKQLIATMHRWKFSALAAAAVATVGLHTPDALALSLGPITVQSALGEPLRAEITLPQVTPAEADSLRVTPASPEVFRAQGMEYSPAVTKVQIKFLRRTDGQAVLRVTSDRAITDPFVDLVVEANWSTGRITRSYTMLFDPPALRRAPAAPTAQAQLPAPQQARPAPAASTAVVARPAPAAAAPASGDSVAVKAGDTAGRIASAHRPADVSLDQMLVALLRANPDAFIQGNVNRLKAGTVLQLPGSAEASATPNGEARKILATQSRDFNEFRRKLAGAAPTAEVAASGRAATGKVQTQVDDQRASSTAPDKLTLSKGAMQGKKSTEEQLAQRKQANEAAARTEELSKNISELSKLSAASAAPGAASPATAAASEPAAPGTSLRRRNGFARGRCFRGCRSRRRARRIGGQRSRRGGPSQAGGGAGAHAATSPRRRTQLHLRPDGRPHDSTGRWWTAGIAAGLWCLACSPAPPQWCGHGQLLPGKPSAA